MKSTWIIILLRLIIGGVFILAGTLKIIDDSTLRDSVGIMVWIPVWAKIWIIDLLPWAEVVLGSAVILAGIPALHRIFRHAELPTLGLYLAFLIYAVVGWVNGQEGDCGCFGSGIGSSFGWVMTLRNTLFVAGALYIFIHSSRFARKPRPETAI